MALAVGLLVSAVAGVLAGYAYHGLQKVASSERLRAALAHWQARWRVPHAINELVFAVIALPLTIAPFAIILSTPRWLAATGVALEPFIVVAAPITGLLALGVTMRGLRKRGPGMRAGEQENA